MLKSVRVVGHGRVGSAISARLRGRGIERGEVEPDLVLLCVPDSAIRNIAATLDVGPWVAHVSGATPLGALAPHVPTFTPS